MNKEQLTVVLAGGGSGGHITPILSLAHELKSKGSVRIIYIGHRGDDPKALAGSDLDVIEYIRGGKFRRYHGESVASHLLDIRTLLLNIRDLWRVIVATIVAWRLLKRYQPNVVFSKGSFVAVPVGLAAHFLRIPIMTHDSDSVPGLANRIIGRWAEINATGMPSNFYSYPPAKIRYVGVPIQAGLKVPSASEQAARKEMLGVNPEEKLMVVTGGGNGSRTLNELMFAGAKKLLDTHKDLHIIILAGRIHANGAELSFRRLLGEEPRLKILGYESELHKLIQAADLVISRAGATSISEFAAMGKACVIIPSPFLAGGHQLQNAEELSKNNAAVVLPNDVTADAFTKTISELLNNPSRRQQLADNLHKLAKTNAASQIASIIFEISRGRAHKTDAA